MRRLVVVTHEENLGGGGGGGGGGRLIARVLTVASCRSFGFSNCLADPFPSLSDVI